jgi:hypothetical protein
MFQGRVWRKTIDSYPSNLCPLRPVTIATIIKLPHPNNTAEPSAGVDPASLA